MSEEIEVLSFRRLNPFTYFEIHSSQHLGPALKMRSWNLVLYPCFIDLPLPFDTADETGRVAVCNLLRQSDEYIVKGYICLRSFTEY